MTSNEEVKADLRFSMGNGQRKFTASNDGDIVRVTIQDGEHRHEWYYLDECEVKKVHELLTAFLGLDYKARRERVLLVISRSKAKVFHCRLHGIRMELRRLGPSREQLLEFARTVLRGCTNDGIYNGRDPHELWNEFFPMEDNPHQLPPETNPTPSHRQIAEEMTARCDVLYQRLDQCALAMVDLSNLDARLAAKGLTAERELLATATDLISSQQLGRDSKKDAASPNDQAATDQAALADAHRMYEALHGKPFDSK